MPRTIIEGVAAPLPMGNLDTDQIMPKQFLRGIDKSGLDKGLFHDLRFDDTEQPRAGFVLNRPEYAQSRMLVAGENFGCGSSREHAVWGLLQYGIQAVIAPSFGEIFYSNAMNNRLLLVAISQNYVERLLVDVGEPASNQVTIDLEQLTVRSARCEAAFELSPRHRRMFIEEMDLVEASLSQREAIVAFEAGHWRRQPWLKSVALAARSLPGLIQP